MNPDAGSNEAPLDYTWEIRRLRKFQVRLVVIQENKLLRQAGEVFPPTEMRQWEEHFAMGHGETEAFLKDLESFESINRLLDMAESGWDLAPEEGRGRRRVLNGGIPLEFGDSSTRSGARRGAAIRQSTRHRARSREAWEDALVRDAS
jgi:hypothetical protein